MAGGGPVAPGATHVTPSAARGLAAHGQRQIPHCACGSVRHDMNPMVLRSSDGRRRASGAGSNPCHPEPFGSAAPELVEGQGRLRAGSCGAWAAPDSSLRLRLRSE